MSDTEATDWQRFVDHCTALPPGPVTNVASLVGLLANVWDDICRDCSGMKGKKLFKRMEDVRWASPILSFVIERHGGYVLGSTRAELQHWQVDVEKKTTALVKSGLRQLVPRAANFPMKDEVASVIDAIRSGKDDERIQWNDPHSVRVMTRKIFPKDSASKMTLGGRRRRFRTLVTEELLKDGWDRLKIDTFQRKSQSDGGG